jgi:hypothetical protein
VLAQTNEAASLPVRHCFNHKSSQKGSLQPMSLFLHSIEIEEQQQAKWQLDLIHTLVLCVVALLIIVATRGHLSGVQNQGEVTTQAPAPGASSPG